MKKLFFAGIVSLFLSLLPLSVPENTLTIIYGIIGVLFSVGMSLVISFNGSNIGNAELKKDIREEMHSIRSNFLFVFVLSSLVYVSYTLMPQSIQQIEWYRFENIVIKSNWSISVIFYHLYSIVAIISNYLDIQRLYEDIEDKMESEMKKNKPQNNGCC